MKSRRLRGLVAFTLVVGVTVAGLLFTTGMGTLSALGIDSVAVLCPLGALASMLGARNVSWHGLLCLGITVILVVLLGKVLCAWACPVPWIQRFFKKRQESGGASSGKPACSSCAAQGCSHHRRHANEKKEGIPAIGGKRDGLHLDGRHVVLAGALGSSALFGFPVFCLLCPIGLTFATLIGLWQLFTLNETGWDLVIFPLILLVEVLVLRKWCTTICPVSALLSLISSANRTFRPSVDPEACLRSRGIDCTVCVDACPEQLDPHSMSIPECSKCRECADLCPAKAISFPLVRSREEAASALREGQEDELVENPAG